MLVAAAVFRDGLLATRAWFRVASAHLALEQLLESIVSLRVLRTPSLHFSLGLRVCLKLRLLLFARESGVCGANAPAEAWAGQTEALLTRRTRKVPGVALGPNKDVVAPLGRAAPRASCTD
jgi:hypothetical protein